MIVGSRLRSAVFVGMFVVKGSEGLFCGLCREKCGYGFRVGLIVCVNNII